MSAAPEHPRKTELLKVRMTSAERAMLRSLAIKSAVGSDSGFVRFLIRQAWMAREMRKTAKVKP